MLERMASGVRWPVWLAVAYLAGTSSAYPLKLIPPYCYHPGKAWYGSIDSDSVRKELPSSIAGDLTDISEFRYFEVQGKISAIAFMRQEAGYRGIDLYQTSRYAVLVVGSEYQDKYITNLMFSPSIGLESTYSILLANRDGQLVKKVRLRTESGWTFLGRIQTLKLEIRNFYEVDEADNGLLSHTASDDIEQCFGLTLRK